jgi:hypothetical protein
MASQGLAGPLQDRIDGRERLRRMRNGQGAECEAVCRVAGDEVGSVLADRLRRGQPPCRRGLPRASSGAPSSPAPSTPP